MNLIMEILKVLTNLAAGHKTKKGKGVCTS